MRDNEAGFALPMVIFLTAIITVLLMAAHTKVNADRRVGEATGANVTALALAKAALQQYLVTRTLRPADGDSVRVNVTGGYGDVIARVIRRPADTLANWIFIVRAVGHVIDPTQGADPQAVRTIAQWAQWQTGRMDTKAAYVAVDGLTDKSGSSFWINGNDSASCGAAATYAIMTKSSNSPAVSNPDSAKGVGAYPSLQSAWAQNTVVDSTNLDWAAILNGGFTPDYTSFQPGNTTYPSQFINGFATITATGTVTGTGILIVKNDLTITGTGKFEFKGIILVGGKIIFDAGSPLAPTTGSYIQGMIAAGLNQGGGKGDIGDKKLVLQYNSCRIRDALAKLTGFAPVPNGWVDNWATY